eukprot:COSAG05_NODE_15757_length_362_cov_0.752852_1_plen_30_part_01
MPHGVYGYSAWNQRYGRELWLRIVCRIHRS